MPHKKGEEKAPGMEMKLEDELAEKLALMLEYDKVPGLGVQWEPVKVLCQYHGMVYRVGRHWGTLVEDLGQMKVSETGHLLVDILGLYLRHPWTGL